MGAPKTYRVVTGNRETLMITADTLEVNENNGRATLKLSGEIVGSFMGYSDCSVYEPVSPPTD